MLQVNITEFRKKLPYYLELANSGEIIAVKQHEKILATVGAPELATRAALSYFSDLQKTAVLGDLISPIKETWDADK